MDNASSDDSAVKLAEQLPTADIILNPRNAGFSGGCNIGMKRALSLGYDYVFLLNNDATADPLCLAELVRASAQLNDGAILGAAVKFADSGQYQFIGSATASATGLPKWLAPENFEPSALMIESDFIFGAAFFIPTAILRSVGLMDERFFLNYEETDLCFRARQQGAKCYVVPSAVVFHQSGATLGDLDSPLQAYFLVRNELLFAEKHSTLRQRLFLYKRRLRLYFLMIKNSAKSRTPPDLRTRSMGYAIRDYALRRFGDCPEAVRRYAAEHRTRQTVDADASEGTE